MLLCTALVLALVTLFDVGSVLKVRVRVRVRVRALGSGLEG